MSPAVSRVSKAAAIGALALAVGAAATTSAVGVAIVVPAAICVLAAAAHRGTLVPVLLASTYLALVLLPELAFIEKDIPIGADGIYVPHLLMIPMAVLAGWKRVGGTLRRPLLGFAVFLIGMVMLGLVRGAPISALVQDSRGPILFLGGVLAGDILYRESDLAHLLRIALSILVASALLIGMQLVTGMEILGGRVREANGFAVGSGGTGLGATRFIVNADDLAVVALLVCVWVYTHRGAYRPSTVVILVAVASAGAVVALSLSRQLILGLVVGIAALFFLHDGLRRIVRAAATSVAVGMAALFVVLVLGAAGVGAGSDTIVGSQIDGFSERILGGFTSENVIDDAGSQWRIRENELAIASVADHPEGTGFGLPYRDEFEVESFGDPDFFRRYVHNVYLWYGTKGGVFGFIALGLVSVVPLAHAFGRSRRFGSDDPIAEVSVLVLSGFGAMSFFAPIIINDNSGVITGVLIAFLGGSGVVNTHRSKDPTGPQSQDSPPIAIECENLMAVSSEGW